MSLKNRIAKLEKLKGNDKFKILIVEKIGEDIYQQWNDKGKKYNSKDLEELIDFYNLGDNEQLEARRKYVEKYLFGNDSD